MVIYIYFVVTDALEEAEEEEVNDKKGKYAEFWKQYSKFIKMGILDDTSNAKRLAKLVRFQRYPSFASKMTSLSS